MNSYYHKMPLEELCARSLDKIKHISTEASSADVAGTSKNQSAIRRSMNYLGEDRILHSDSLVQLDLAMSIISSELDCETLEIVPVFHGRNDPEEGAIGKVVQERVLTERGDRIAECLGTLRVLRTMLQILQNRVAAERIINRRFGS